MHLTRDELKDKIFELEMEQEELQSLIDTISGGWSEFEETLNKMIQELQENQCYIQYYKQLLQETEQGK